MRPARIRDKQMNTYRKIFTLILLQFVITHGIAQNCSFSKNETDKFTNERVLYTSPTNLISGKVKIKRMYTIKKIEMQLKYENKAYKMYLSFHFALGLTVVNTNNNVILLLSNGAKVELPCIQNTPDSDYKYSGMAIHSFNFALSEENFISLLESDITDIRVASTLNPIEFSVNPIVKTSELFNCIKQNK